jgi:5-methylcytosine-specific restriction endonuclease McrA
MRFKRDGMENKLRIAKELSQIKLPIAHSDRKENNCIDCGKEISLVAKRCGSCSSKAQWKNPEIRQRNIDSLKKAFPSIYSHSCIDCGKYVKGSAERCWECRVVYLKTNGVSCSVEKKEKLRLRATERYANTEYRLKWKAGIDERTNSEDWKRKHLANLLNRTDEFKDKVRSAVKRRMENSKWRDSMKDNPCWKRGREHPCWLGTSSERQIAYRSKEYKLWRNSVFARDDYTCQSCKKKGGALHAHHIKTWKDHAELRYDVSNGQTLCVDCHSKHHGHYIPGRPINMRKSSKVVHI